MGRWQKPVKREFLCQGIRKEPGRRRSHEVGQLGGMREDEILLVQCAGPLAENPRSLAHAQKAGLIPASKTGNRLELIIVRRAFEKSSELARARGVAQLAQSLRLNLANAL